MKTAQLLAALLIGIAFPAFARDVMDPLSTAKAFSAALAAGDEKAVKSLLAAEVLIYESGGQESSRDEYAHHHMKADMEFLANAQIQVIDRKHGVGQDQAWVATRSRVTTKFRDKNIDIYSTETLVLKLMPGGWQIVHVQWSSQPVEPKKAK